MRSSGANLNVALQIKIRDYLNGLKVKEQEDFQGLVFKAAEAIEGGSCLWDRKEGCGDLSKLKYIFIDEYQDFSPLFYKLLSSVRKINPSAKVFCVGDDWQAINAFAGSDLKYFREFKGYFHNGDVLSLTTNYRSSSDIVELGNRVMKDEGIPSKTDKPPTGDIWCANIEEFKPVHAEEHGYKENMVTPALVRLIHSFIDNNRQVALLSRRKNGWPWYNPYGIRFRDMLLKTIREAFPENKRSMIKTIDSVHSFKGKQEDAIIIVDAVERSFPLIHPDNIFYQILGQTLEDVISDEKRLFYVALSRAKSSLIFITGGNNISPFLRHINLNNIDWDKYQPPHRQGSKYLISITGKTFEIKELLKSHHFTWSPANQVWGKHIAADNFSEVALVEEPWFQRASGISISVHDEFDNKIYSTIKK
jgi:DNA helicase-4